MSNIDESMYRLTVAQRDAAWREVELWREKYEGLTKLMADHMMAMTHPPMKMLANAESFNAGKAMAFNEATYTVGIDTTEGVHTVTVFRMLPSQPTTLVASARLQDTTREDIAQLVEAMGMQGYGTLAIAAAIRKGKS
jgi:hypothetical protein